MQLNHIHAARPHADNVIEQRVRFEGHYRIEKGRRNPDTGAKEINGVWEFDNLITNNGLDMIGGTESVWWDYCSVGTDTTPEAVGDTTMGAGLATVWSGLNTESRSTRGSAPYYSSLTQDYNFGEGVAAGNISEIGIGPDNAYTNLFSRALVKDGASPLATTTITVLSDEFLDVYYELRMYPDHVGSPHGSGTIFVDTNSPRGTTTYEIAAAKVTNSANLGHVGYAAAGIAVSSNLATIYGPSGTLGAVTGNPSATQSDNITTPSAWASATYTPGTYYRDITLTIALADGNLAGSPLGFDTIMFHTRFGSYQVKFGQVFDKTATKIFTFTVRLAWARATI